MSKNNVKISPKDQYESLLLALPKNCDCHICKETIELARQNIEPKRFKYLFYYVRAT